MDRITNGDVLKAQKVKNPNNMPVLLASRFTGDEGSDHKILTYNPVDKTYIFDSKRNGHQVHHTHFYMDRAISEYNLFDV